jgi:hypothetical protein
MKMNETEDKIKTSTDTMWDPHFVHGLILDSPDTSVWVKSYEFHDFDYLKGCVTNATINVLKHHLNGSIDDLYMRWLWDLPESRDRKNFMAMWYSINMVQWVGRELMGHHVDTYNNWINPASSIEFVNEPDYSYELFATVAQNHMLSMNLDGFEESYIHDEFDDWYKTDFARALINGLDVPIGEHDVMSHLNPKKKSDALRLARSWYDIRPTRIPLSYVIDWFDARLREEWIAEHDHPAFMKSLVRGHFVRVFGSLLVRYEAYMQASPDFDYRVIAEVLDMDEDLWTADVEYTKTNRVVMVHVFNLMHMYQRMKRLLHGEETEGEEE